MSKPTVTAHASIDPVTHRELADPVGHTTVGVDVTVTFELGDHAYALGALEAAVANVRAQIAAAAEGQVSDRPEPPPDRSWVTTDRSPR